MIDTKKRTRRVLFLLLDNHCVYPISDNSYQRDDCCFGNDVQNVFHDDMGKLKKTGSNLAQSFWFCFKNFDYPSWIASEGQTLAQLPQSMHNSGSIEYFSPSEIAP